MPGGRGNIKGDDNTNGFQVNPQNRNKNGRPKGSLNRSTIAKRVLSMAVKYPEQIKTALKEMYPDLPDNMDIEEVMTLVQVNKAIMEKDSQAYRAVMDSAYGMPTQGIKEVTEVDEIEIGYEDFNDED